MGGCVEIVSDGCKVIVLECIEFCVIECGMWVLGGKWMGFVFWYFKDEFVWFNDFCWMIGGVSKKMIFDCLCYFEVYGLVLWIVFEICLVVVEYFIMVYGCIVLDFLGVLKDWSEVEVVGLELSVVLFWVCGL